jgi:hypothetical protein
LPNGGVVVNNAYIAPGFPLGEEFVGLDAGGVVRWTHPMTPPANMVDYPIDARPVVDADGVVVLATDLTGGSQRCGDNDNCYFGYATFVDQTSGAVVDPPITMGTDRLFVSYADVTTNTLYIADEHEFPNEPSNQLDSLTVPGLSRNFLSTFGAVPYGPPSSGPSAVIQSPALTDHLLIRRLKITAPDRASSFDYGWLPPTATGSSPTMGLQHCANQSGDCTVSYAVTTPRQVGWHLLVRSVSPSGVASSWIAATDSTGSTAITIPSQPVLVAVGDSITSGHHRSGNFQVANCNDMTYGYPQYVWNFVEGAMPSQWRGTGYYNFARSGFSTAKVISGGTDACKAAYGSGSPLHDAEAILHAHRDSWERVVITAGVDDTNWGKVLERVAQDSLLGANILYTPGLCSADVSTWDGWHLTAQTTTNIQSILAGLESPQSGSATTQVYWVGYYNVAPAHNYHAPVPAACGPAMQKAVDSLNSQIKTIAGTEIFDWISVSAAMDKQTGLMQSWYATDVPAMLANLTAPGWPHPNPTGAQIIAGLVPISTS